MLGPRLVRWAIFVAAAIAVAVAIAFAGSGTQPTAPQATPTVSVPTVGPVTTQEGETPTLRARLKRPIDEILDELPFTNIAFAAPTRLRLDQTAVVTLKTSDEQSIQELQSQLRNVGRREGARIRASDVMEATLTGIDFEIRQITPKQQPVGAAVTEWKWQVRPTEAGKHDLELSLTAIIAINGRETPYAVRTFARTLEVSTVPVSPGRRITRFIEDNWQWLLTTLLIPLGIWAYRRRAEQRAAAARQAKRKKVKR